MTVNEVLIRHNFISKVLFKDGENSLSNELKIKLMGIRIEYGKIRKDLDQDLKEFVEGLTTDDIKEITQKPKKTQKDIDKINAFNEQIKKDYDAYVNKRGMEEVKVKDSHLTQDEYDQIVIVNSGNDVEINGTKLPAPDFLEVIYTLFVE
jgi:hypothetical protein